MAKGLFTPAVANPSLSGPAAALENPNSSVASTQISESALRTIEQLYQWEDFIEVRRQLVAHPGAVDALFQAAVIVPKFFGPNTTLSLRAVSTSEGQEAKELSATIQTSLEPTEALERLEEFDQEWWLQLVPRLNGILSIGLSFV